MVRFATRISRGTRRRIISFTGVFLMVALGGCAGGRQVDRETSADLIQRGEDLLAREKYREAQEVFTRFLDRYPSDAAAGQAQLGLARSLMGVNEWEAAREELRVLLTRYAGSPQVEEARFLMGVAYARESLPYELDQELTGRALDEFEAYRTDFPRGSHRPEAQEERAALRDKLAEKQNSNGWLYLRMGFPEAARVYFETVLRTYGDSSQVVRARFGLAEVQRSLGNLAEAAVFYRELLESGVDGKLKEECEERLRELGSRFEGQSPG